MTRLTTADSPCCRIEGDAEHSGHDDGEDEGDDHGDDHGDDRDDGAADGDDGGDSVDKGEIPAEDDPEKEQRSSLADISPDHFNKLVEIRCVHRHASTHAKS